ncbi:Sporulation and spore germination [Hathewaya proteolytica DSM 3090]|uniref:Sporulation and spore germination n=1 Tax=Hathewaya proteolytica DSM 3090 TaxID=1121331 RepID=A0A1M6LGW1_9CLOT|nr:GerMN domain-containing protein [Hathewaya proteolytica]SHJ70368.1 Sporulation and spore germination [Hathewaya proteolytica DSM 3090]
MKMKKIINYVLICLMALSLVACTKNVTTNPGDESSKINENNISKDNNSKDNTQSGDNNGGQGDTQSSKDDKDNFNLYFGDSEAEHLVAEVRKIENADAKKVLEELILGPTEKDIYMVIDKTVKVNSVTIKDKVANVDFDNSILGKVSGSAGETMALYGISNTLILNTQLGIEKVTFSVNKDPMDTLGGHIILDKPVGSNTSIIKK